MHHCGWRLFKWTFLSLSLSLITLFPLHAQSHSQPTVMKCASSEEVGEACARSMADLIYTNLQQGKQTVLGLATGSTPLPVYAALIRIAKEENLDLSRVITFNLDEYVGLPEGHPQSYQTFMEEHLFGALRQSEVYPKGLRSENIHLLNGYAKRVEDLTSDEMEVLNRVFRHRDPNDLLSREEEMLILGLRAEEYEKLLHICGPIDFQILGIGTNGHIGFAEPGSSFKGHTSVVELSSSTRQDNQRFFVNDTIEVPSHAITMGIGTILQAKNIVLLATGSHKRAIIEQTLNERISSAIPATALRLRPHVTFILDLEAAGNIE